MRICVFGDSIAFGHADYKYGGWVQKLNLYLLEKSDAEDSAYNCGISGDTTKDVLKRFDIEAKAREPDIIIFSIGINDARYLNKPNNLETQPEQFKENLKQLLEMAREHTDKILFLGLTPIDESKTMPIPWDTVKFYPKENVHEFNKIIETFCEENNLLFIELINKLDPKNFEDGLHPDSESHNIIFETVKDFLEKNKWI